VSRAKASYDLKVMHWSLRSIKPSMYKGMKVYLDRSPTVVTRDAYEESSCDDLNDIHDLVHRSIASHGGINIKEVASNMLPIVPASEAVGYQSTIPYP
jgi:hypothetical protein